MKQTENERNYQLTMHFVRKMLKDGLITKEEYYTIDEQFLQKYSPIFGQLFSNPFLTFLEDRAIYDEKED